LAVAAVVGVATAGAAVGAGAEQTRPRRTGDARMAAGEASVAAAARSLAYSLQLFRTSCIGFSDS